MTVIGVGQLTPEQRAAVLRALGIAVEGEEMAEDRAERLYEREYAYADKPSFLVRYPYASMTVEEQRDYLAARGLEISAEHYRQSATVRYVKLARRIQQRMGGG